MTGPVVSVLCTTYNQEGYIAQALNSLLMQETDFDFEIIVHDDASTDRTTAIVREYERAHPGIVRCIYQTENQYSQGVDVISLSIASARGEYIALCEGDDYWVDPLKLQKQVDLMRADSDCSLCVHATIMVSPNGSPVGLIRAATEDRRFTLGEVIVEGSRFFHTSSYLFPASLAHDLPEYYHRCPVRDWPLALFLSSMGGVRYIDQRMSAYRTNAVNSWSRSMQDVSMQVAVSRGIQVMLRAFDEATGRSYSADVARLIEKYDFTVALAEGRWADAKESWVYGQSRWRTRVAISARKQFPRLASIRSRVRRVRG